MCGGLKSGAMSVAGMLGRNQTLFLRSTEIATFSCTSTRKDALKKHQASQQHNKSALEELGVQIGPNGNPLVGTPPFEVFSEVLAKLQSGSSAKKIDRGGTRDRLKNIKFCLLEANQETDKACMQSVATMVSLRDERHGRLLLWFADCTRNLEVRRGTFWSLAGLCLSNRREFGKGN